MTHFSPEGEHKAFSEAFHHLRRESLSQNLVQIRQTLEQLKSHMSVLHIDLSAHTAKSQELQVTMNKLLERSESLAIKLIES